MCGIGSDGLRYIYIRKSRVEIFWKEGVDKVARNTWLETVQGWYLVGQVGVSEIALETVQGWYLVGQEGVGEIALETVQGWYLVGQVGVGEIARLLANLLNLHLPTRAEIARCFLQSLFIHNELKISSLDNPSAKINVKTSEVAKQSSGSRNVSKSVFQIRMDNIVIRIRLHMHVIVHLPDPRSKKINKTRRKSISTNLRANLEKLKNNNNNNIMVGSVLFRLAGYKANQFLLFYSISDQL